MSLICVMCGKVIAYKLKEGKAHKSIYGICGDLCGLAIRVNKKDKKSVKAKEILNKQYDHIEWFNRFYTLKQIDNEVDIYDNDFLVNQKEIL